MTDSFYALSGKTRISGVMGWPVEHTKSPRLHAYWLQKNKIDGAYIPMAVPKGRIEQALRAMPVLGFCGCNVTIPHKEEAMKYVDELDPLAKRVGAVNTIVVKQNGRLEGKNTDVYGFTENLRVAGFQLDPALPVATVLGAGGAARAVVIGLQDMGFQEIRIVNRSAVRAEELARAIAGTASLKLFGEDEKNKAMEDSGLLINATSLGMTGREPLDINLSALPKRAWVTDAVYAPLETELLKQARQKNRRAVDGLGMLLYQAQEGFSAWYGVEPKVTKELRAFVLESEG